MLQFAGAGATDVGRVREHNEDSAFLGARLALVADGVGGAAAGEVASATATHVLASVLRGQPGQRAEDLPRLLAAAVEAARTRIVDGVRADPQRAGMATTLTALATDGRAVVLAHVGDSRAYRLSGAAMDQVSRDHTYVQQLVDHGQLAPAAARRHPWRNVILRSLSAGGVARDAGDGAVEVTSLPAAAGDRLMVCSDGLTDLVTDEVIAAILGSGSAQSAADRLVASALAAGGFDNVTCLVVDVVDGPRAIGAGEFFGAVKDFTNVVAPVSGAGTLPA